MEQISENFKMAEFSMSDTAYREGIDNTITEAVKPAIRNLVLKLLQPICDMTGWRCHINSGYRSKGLNTKVGGVESSQHRKGEAADCMYYTTGKGYVKPIEVAKEIISAGLEFDQMIIYNGFVHLSYTTTRPNRRQLLYNKSYIGTRL